MANNIIQVKRTSVAGRTPNTTSSGNTQYIPAGGLALNMADYILYSSDGSALIEIGANNTTSKITNSVSIGANTVITGDSYTVGNSSVNTMISSTQVNTDIFNADVAVYVGANVDITTAGVLIGNSTVNTTTNSTGFFVNGASVVAGYQTTAGLSANVATLTSNNSLYLGGVIAASYVNTSQLSSNLANYIDGITASSGLTGGGTSGNVTVSVLANNGIVANSTGVFVVGGSGLVTNATGVHIGSGNGVVIAADNIYVLSNTGIVSNSTGLFVNSAYIGTLSANNAAYLGGVIASSYTTATQLTNNLANYTTTSALSSNLANYINGVTAGSGLTGGGTEGNVTVTVLANSGIVANSTGTFVNANTGLVANSTGLFVNATYIGTLSANNAAFLGGVAAASYVNTSQLTSNLANYINGVTAGSGLTGGGTEGNVTVTVLANNGIVANSTGVFVTGGSGLVTNSTGVHVGSGNGIVIATDNIYILANTGIVSNATGLYVNSTYIGTLSANNAAFLGGVAAASYTTSTQLTNNLANYTTTSALSSNLANYINGVTAGNGLTGGGTEGNVTVSVLANTGIIANSTGLFLDTASIAAGGANTEVQYNNSGVLGANNLFTYNSTTKTLTVGNTTVNSVVVSSEGGSINWNVATSFTLSAGRNAVVAGPYTVASGNTVTVETGARLVVV